MIVSAALALLLQRKEEFFFNYNDPKPMRRRFGTERKRKGERDERN